MSWSDYTHKKHFSSGIYRPYSDFLADILLDVDNRLASEPAFARSLVPFPTRDTLFVLGESVSIVAISRVSHRHYPLFEVRKWNDFWTTSEPEMIAGLGLSLKDASRLSRPPLDAILSADYSFVDPIVFSVPSLFQAQPNTPAAEARNRGISSAADLIWSFERKRYENMLEMEKPKDIFLSHKSANKELVREIARTLGAIGFQPWLDEDKMKAGANLERAIRDGFTNSCAAVFFVTPDFVDDGFLATEIDYALAEKRSKGDRFSIITLLLRGANGTFGTVPQMIRQYVWKEVEPVAVTRTIVESLPIRMERAAMSHR